MAVSWLIVALLGAVVYATPLEPRSPRQSRQSSPCGDLASAMAESTTGMVPANFTYECLRSVPVQKEFSTRLVNGAKAWFELLSDIDYVANPPSGSLWPSMDMFGYLEKIAKDVENDAYQSQYDIDIDMYSFSLHFHDYHTTLSPGLSRVCSFDRGLELVYYSNDGLAAPDIYIFEDVVGINDSGILVIEQNSLASPIDTINGLPVQEFLQTQALVAQSHDPDAMYAQLFVSPPSSFNPAQAWTDLFRLSPFYPGPTTDFQFKNGTRLDVPTLSSVNCDVTNLTSGQEFWQTCVFEPEEVAASSLLSSVRQIATPAPTTTAAEYTSGAPYARAEPTFTATITQLLAHPEPIAIDQAGLLSGYDLEGHDDISVFVVRSFDSDSPNYQYSFQNTLSDLLEDAKARRKTKLILDMQGNPGGFIDLSVELMAQLFPNVAPNQKANFRASLGLQIILEKESAELEYYDQNSSSTETTALLEGGYSTAWQAVMDPDMHAFDSFEDFYGPNKLDGQGAYTHFFQSNYTNTIPSQFRGPRIQITGYGERPVDPDTPPPFMESNIVILSDGLCGSACTIVAERLTNVHGIPSIVVGGRPSTGPMQAIGNTKGSLLFDESTLQSFLYYWEDDSITPTDQSKVAGTIFEHLELFGLAHGVRVLNGKNNYRLGDKTETPLQMVYTAADCRIWPTADMIVDQTVLWKRVAEIAFDDSRDKLGAEGGPYTSEYCVADSTGHSTSVTGGLKQGELGDQNPPKRAYPQYSGWLKDGREIVQGLSLVRIDDAGSTNSSESNTPASSSGDSNVGAPRLTDEQVKVGLSNLKTACNDYSGDKWLMKLLCRVFS